MMDFQKYRALSEDAQRLLCYYVGVGLGTNRRMNEHLYVLNRYCFSSFKGQSALDELMDTGIIYESGRDWYTNSTKYGVRKGDIVPSLCYLFEYRKDFVEAYKDLKTVDGGTYKSLHNAIQQLVASGYTEATDAHLISSDQAEMLLWVADEPKMIPLINSLAPETFIHLFDSLSEFWMENDVVCDTAMLAGIVMKYGGITELNRYKFIASLDLYNYIATGKMPDGIYREMSEGCLLAAMNLLNNGKYEQSLAWFDKSLKLLKSVETRRGMFHNAVLNFYLMLCYIHVGDDLSKSRINTFLQREESRTWTTLLPSRVIVEDHLGIGEKTHRETLHKMYKSADMGELPVLYKYFAFMISNYLGLPSTDMIADECVPKIAMLRHEMSPFVTLDSDDREQLDKAFGTSPVLNSIEHKAAWESVLEALAKEASGAKSVVVEQDIRLMYLRPSMLSNEVLVREQTRLKNGSWGSGKSISDARFRQGNLPYMNDADRRIVAKLQRSIRWNLTIQDVAEELVGDNRLYYGRTAPYLSVKVDRDKPYLIVEREEGKFVVKSNVPRNRVDDDCIVVENSPTHYSVIALPPDTRNFYKQLLEQAAFPLSAEQTLRSLLPLIGGKVELHSSLIEGGSTLPLVDGNALIGFQLRPKQNNRYEVVPFVRPLMGGNKTYTLCEGDNVIIDENSEGRVRVSRNMEAEMESLEVVRRFWDKHGYDYGDEENDTYPPDFMLDLLQFVQDNPSLCYAEWPEGQTIKIRALSSGGGSWSGSLKSQGEWFSIEGEIQMDDDTVLSINQLLDLIGQGHGRYVQLGEGEFLALSDKLRQQLMKLDAVVNRERGRIRISPFSAAFMQDDTLNGEIRFMLDGKLIDIRKRIMDSSNYRPDPPEELSATLRPYQLDGYQWMARLNSWGAGALLADDMGLGKTIQTIAFLLLKKNDGPSLVVAPASVAPNWKSELDRFAPTLNSQVLNFATNRAKVIEDAKAGDVIITTYGILLSIQDNITKKKWNVACLDEAHIIKNRGAKTSAAAMKIKADNRVMLTGTPVQNHLGELWSLFQFVNPGMLGGYEQFSHKFILPIQNNHDKERQEQLDQIVHPFMLRRTKQAVLKELPDKTEIYHQVELSTEELAVYESIRKRAENLIANKMKDGKEMDMNVLAEIMRLRQAACSAQLIEPKWSGESSKIITLVELLQGIIEGGNRALVFSQFVSFFDLVKKELDKRGMEYFYIDGSVSVKKRTEMVERFQNGENALFLISLKAGGLGLNLTGANYVFHLDPWWNPAIEQQATDRAYRIGQQQAVTVYHLISKHTIEEKIIRLHQTKRDLADNLLDGTDMSYKLTGKDLLEMIAR